MPRVLITNHSGHDHSAAERFGELVYMTCGELNRYDTNNMYRSMSATIELSKPDDYILLTSLTSLCSIACSMFAYKHGCLNLLIWKGRNYVERRQMLGELLTRNKY